MPKISSDKLIQLIEDYRKAYICSLFPCEFALYKYDAKVRIDRHPVDRLWSIYLEDQWNLYDNPLLISLATEKVVDSIVSGKRLVPTLERLLSKVKDSLIRETPALKESAFPLSADDSSELVKFLP